MGSPAPYASLVVAATIAGATRNATVAPACPERGATGQAANQASLGSSASAVST